MYLFFSILATYLAAFHFLLQTTLHRQAMKGKNNYSLSLSIIKLNGKGTKVIRKPYISTLYEHNAQTCKCISYQFLLCRFIYYYTVEDIFHLQFAENYLRIPV